MKKRYLYVFLFLLLLTAPAIFSSAVPTLKADHNPTWWDYDWNQRLEYTVNHTLVDEDLVTKLISLFLSMVRI